MSRVAVVANVRKNLDGGLAELRKVLEGAGFPDALWYEIPKSKTAGKRVREAINEGASVVFVWGGDGTIQRSLEGFAGSDAALAIVPAGTANLLATNLGVPRHIRGAVEVGLRGDRREIDVGVVNGERFCVMAGGGFDARMIRDASRERKDRFGRLAYIASGARHLRDAPTKARIRVDGESWVDDRVACVLVGNVGSLFGGVTIFDRARPDDGRLDVGVINTDGVLGWMRALARTAFGHAERSPFVEVTSGRSIDVKFDRKVAYELDGGDRSPTKRLRIEVEPASLTVCVPRTGSASG